MATKIVTNKKNGSVHVLFRENKITISPDLNLIFNFLIEIERELQSFLFVDKKLEEIRRQSIETFELVGFLAKKLEENNIEWSFNLMHNPDSLVEKLKFDVPVRSQMIGLFSYLETIFCLYISYQDENADESYIRTQAMNSEINKKFINKMLLSQENDFYNKNRKRFWNLSAKKIRELRNMLNHFFSISGKINIVPSVQSDKAKRAYEILKWHGYTLLSVEDMFSLVSWAMKNLVQIWSDDFERNQIEFERKIQFPKKIVRSHGAIIMRESDINI